MAGTVDRRFMAALKAAQDLVDQMVDGHTKWLVSAWLQVWADAERGINDILAGRHGVGGVGADSVRQRMILWQAAQDQAQAHLSALLRDVSVEAVRVAEELAEVAIKSRLEVVEAQLPPGTVATNLIVQPNPGAVAQIVERATQQITVRHYYLEAEAAQAMKRALLWGTVQGRNPREMAARMVREVQGVFNGGLTRAMVIARTEMIDAYRNAQHEFDLANRDVLEGWQWQAELSDRTCFPAGTKVSTDHGPVAIEQLRSGDRVLTHTGSYRMVSETMNRSYAGIMVTIDTPTGRVTSTGDHPILVEREGKLDWMEAREVRAGDSVFSDRQGVPNGSDHSIGKRAVELRVGDTNDRIATGLHEPVLAGIREIVSNVTHHYQLLDVYNIEVEEDHSYIANGFVVHNCRSCLAMHGTLHDIEEPGPLDHHQGRCARVPVTKTWAALGFAQPQETRVWIDGDEAERWLERQPVEVQQRILTRRGYQAWQEGRWPRAEWTERRENPEWRPAYHAAKPPAEPLAAPPALPAAPPALGR